MMVCRECLPFRELSHIDQHINGFLRVGHLKEACILGSLRLMKLAAARNTKVYWGDVAIIAAKQGHLDILQWLSECTEDRCDWGKVLDLAAAYGHLPIVKWLHTHYQDIRSTNAMDEAALRGHLDVVKWLHDNRTEGCSTRAMNGAASNGYLDVVKWLHNNRSEGCTVYAMTWAAQYGHLDVVKWLHENTGKGCADYIMDGVVNLDVLKWLHENLRGGWLCSTEAIDKAAELGRLDVVMWLYENRTEGYSAHAIEMAARNGHLDVVKWLLHHEGDKRRYDCRGDWGGFCDFCNHGSRKWYYIQYESLYDFTVKMARMNGQQHVIKWVESLGDLKTANKWRAQQGLEKK
ncbi:hypothetical protein DVH05_024051 [Phytophthora capsici]|nr:hypothetical protein DVH05_024051 [Phytophthora capsici]